MVKRLGLWKLNAGGTDKSKQPHDYYQDSLAGKVNDQRLGHLGLSADRRPFSLLTFK